MKVRKILSLAFIGILMLSSMVYAQSVTATFGDQNSSNEYRIKADTDGVVTFASDTGIKYPYEYYNPASPPTTNTLTAAETGKFIMDVGGITLPATTTGLGFGSKHVLPRAEVGLAFTLAAGSQCSVTLDVAGPNGDPSDVIMYSVSSTGLDIGDSIKSTGQAGDSVTVMCPVANKWMIVDMQGTWTDNSTN